VRLEEALQIARAMFTEEQPSFEGRHYRIRNVLNNPRPLRGDIPIMVGGSGERKTLRLVAKYADACNLFGDVERSRHLLGVLEGHCEAVGRDPAEITKTRMARVLIAPSHEEAYRKLDAVRQAGLSEERLRMMVMAGDPGEVAEQAQAFRDAGIEGLTISMPDVHDLELVKLAGETLAPVMGSPAG
jgi:alkanesulfonate monooxygenase SsuD/methylene tetrahydromethanopterin reductase-like flavin-dependent oxidoreductase (luciferase family)